MVLAPDQWDPVVNLSSESRGPEGKARGGWDGEGRLQRKEENRPSKGSERAQEGKDSAWLSWSDIADAGDPYCEQYCIKYKCSQ